MANEPNLLRDNSLLRDQAPAGAPKGLSDPLGGAAAKARAAANDDRETIGAILRSLQYHPREGTYIVATLFALAWLAADIVVVWLYLPELRALLGQGSIALPAIVGMTGVLLLPILFFYILAHMTARTRELHRVAHSMAELAVRFAEPELAAGNAITNVGQAVRREVAAMSEGVERTLTRAAELEKLVQDEVQALERGQRDNETRMLGIMQDLTRHREKLAEQTDRLADASSAGAEYAVRAADAMHSYVEAFDKRFDARALEAAKGMDQRFANFASDMNNRIAILENALSDCVRDMTRTLAENGDAIAGSLSTRIKEANALLDTTGRQIGQAIGGKMSDFEDSMGRRAIAIAANLETLIADFERHTIGRAQAMSETVNKQIGEAASAIAARAEESAQAVALEAAAAQRSLGEASDEAARKLATVSAKVSDELQSNTGAIEQRLTAFSTGMNEALRQDAEEIERKLTAVSAGMSEVLRQDVEETERKLLAAGGSVSRDLIGRGDEITAKLSAQAASMAHVLSDQGGGLLDALAARSETLSRDAQIAIDRVFDTTAAQEAAFTAKIVESTGKAAGTVTDAARSAQATIDRSLTEFLRGSQAAIEQTKESAAASVADIRQTHTMLRTENASLFGQLREANILLQDVLNGAHGSMTTLEQTLGARLNEFTEAMNAVTERSASATGQMSAHLASFNSDTIKVLDDLSQLAAKFETHGRVLVQAADFIDTSNRRSEESANNRQSGMVGLIAAVESKSTELDERLTRFRELLDNSLETAAMRARDISRLVAESTTEGMRSINEQADRVREISEAERKRIGEALRGMNEKALGEAKALANQSTERFADMLRQFRDTTAQMQRQIDASREDLRRVRAEPARPERAETPPVSPAAPAPAGKGKGAPWLSGGLNRGARAAQETPPPPRARAGSLETLTREIAGLVDNDAASDVWDRYNRGERNVFSRRLYTVRGQIVFDEVRARYRDERNFQRAVDDYIAKFERVLTNVPPDDVGQAAIRASLASDAGKVFMLLGHASGRFD